MFNSLGGPINNNFFFFFFFKSAFDIKKFIFILFFIYPTNMTASQEVCGFISFGFMGM